MCVLVLVGEVYPCRLYHGVSRCAARVSGACTQKRTSALWACSACACAVELSLRPPRHRRAGMEQAVCMRVCGSYHLYMQLHGIDETGA